MPQQSVSQAAFWMAGWLLMTLAMTFAGRELAHDVPVFVLMIFRSIVATLILGPIVLWHGNLRARFARFPTHVIRNIIHYSAQYAWFTALIFIPVAQVISIEFTMPIWILILATLFLGEKMTSAKIIAVVLGFIGIVLIVRPEASNIDVGHLSALYAAIGFAVSVTLTKYLTRSDSVLTVIFLMFAIQTVIGALPAWYYWQWPHRPESWLWAAIVALAGTGSHFCLTKAMSLADATIVMPMDFLRVPLSALLAYWLYLESFDLRAVLGAALILVANAINVFKARKA